MQVEGREVEVLMVFPVMHSGWECDEKGFVVNDNGTKKIVLTNHGSAYFASEMELSLKIEEYKHAIASAESALDIIKENK